MRILITDGNERVALAAARSLVRAGHSVCVTAGKPLSLAGVSRGVRSRPVTTDPLIDPAQYVAELNHILRQEGTNVLLPMTDPSVEAVLEHRHALPAAVAVPFPDLATYRAGSNKAGVLELARSCGFAVPETRVIHSPSQHDDALPDDFFPAVIKPHRSVVGVGKNRTKLVVTPVADAAECQRVLAGLPVPAFPVLLQKWVPGVAEGLFALRWEGRVIALFAHRRLREKPPTGGVSVYRESIALDDRLVGPGLRLLEELDWQGVAMIECKRDTKTGRYVVMEINGRFWGSLQLAIDAGVDFPVLLVHCVAGEEAIPARSYRVGVRSRWFWGDVDHFYLRLRNRIGSRWSVVRDFVSAFLHRDRSEVWRWRDPLPFAVETLQWLGLLTPYTADATSRSTAAPRESVPDSVAP